MCKCGCVCVCICARVWRRGGGDIYSCPVWEEEVSMSVCTCGCVCVCICVRGGGGWEVFTVLTVCVSSFHGHILQLETSQTVPFFPRPEKFFPIKQ